MKNWIESAYCMFLFKNYDNCMNRNFQIAYGILGWFLLLFTIANLSLLVT